MTELKNRGVTDIFIACVDGLKGFPEAIEAIFPRTQVQLCLVHLMRFSLCYVSFKDRKGVAADLKAVYRAVTAVKPPPRRITLGYAPLKSAREIWVLASGTGKEDALRCVLSDEKPPLPLGTVISSRDKSLIFSDIKI